MRTAATTRHYFLLCTKQLTCPALFIPVRKWHEWIINKFSVIAGCWRKLVSPVLIFIYKRHYIRCHHYIQRDMFVEPKKSVCFYRPQRSWGKAIFSQAYVILFIGGSASVHAGIPPPWAGTLLPQEQAPPRSRHPPEQAPPRSRPPPPAQSMLGDTVNARVVRILLECNLVFNLSL